MPEAYKVTGSIEINNVDQVKQQLADVSKQVDETSDNLSDGKASALKFGDSLKAMVGSAISVSAIAGAVALVADQMKEMERAAVESAQTQARLEAVLNATGGAAGMTALSLDALATSISEAAGLDDELVKSSEAVMLTFTQIGKNTFPTAMRAAADMSAVFGTDLQSSVMQVGKAMNDFTGYSALTRSGVSFTAEQKEQIKQFEEANDLIGYQKLVLGELNREFGGAAKAITDAGDSSEKTKIAIENLKESMGIGLIPITKQVNEAVIEYVNSLEEKNNAVYREKDALDALGIQYGLYNTYVLNGVKITREQVDALLNNAQVANNATANYEAMARALGVVGEVTTDTSGKVEELTGTYKTMISMTANFTSQEESYAEKNKNLTEERIDLESQRSEKLKQGYSEEGSVIKGLDEKLKDNADEAQANADEHEKATKRIVLGYLQQQLAQDGLSEEETNFLLEKGVEWGIYSDTAIKAMQDAMDEADKLKDHLDNIPENLSTTITVNTVTNYSSGSIGQAELLAGVDLNGNGVIGAASGLYGYRVPAGYPHDNYPIRVSSGEKVTVEPASEKNKRSGASGVNVYGDLVIQMGGELSAEQILASLGA